ncbi:MAG: hypothetical protein AUJ56_06830 [Zetaproteobacteria bacterium CG1_02_49_23]|nr:MAG: hypothetical protein AUJ56_06830 [Zetaproteobacteria bacterium CG1_02_49_23]
MTQKLLTDIPDIGESTASKLIEHGIASVQELCDGGVERLMTVPGFGAIRAERIVAAAMALAEEGAPSAESEQEVLADEVGKKKKSAKKEKKAKAKGKSKKSSKKAIKKADKKSDAKAKKKDGKKKREKALSKKAKAKDKKKK